MKTKSGVFSLEGRIGRGKYRAQLVIFMLLITLTLIEVVSAITYIPAALAGGKVAPLLVLLVTIGFQLVLSQLIICSGAKRCHDLGKPHYYLLIPFYPLVLAFGEGDIGANEYGPNPNDKDNPAEVGGWLFSGGVVAVLGAYFARYIEQSMTNQVMGVPYGPAYGYQIDSSGYYAFAFVAGAIALLGLGLIIAGLSRNK